MVASKYTAVAAAACWPSPLAAAAVLPPAHLVSMHVGMLDHRGFLRTPRERLTRAIGLPSGASEGGMSSHMTNSVRCMRLQCAFPQSRKLVLNRPKQQGMAGCLWLLNRSMRRSDHYVYTHEYYGYVFQGTCRWAIMAQAWKSCWGNHSANASGQAAAKEEHYIVVPKDKGVYRNPFSSSLTTGLSSAKPQRGGFLVRCLVDSSRAHPPVL